MTAVGSFLSPFFQWWYPDVDDVARCVGRSALPQLQWGAGAPKHSRWLWAIPGYLTAVMAFTIYAPFIIPWSSLEAVLHVVIQTVWDGMGIGALY
jgi:hypothetical protein